MKRCPECRRDYYDETLLYCLEDGTPLVQGSVSSPNEPQTAILPSGTLAGGAAAHGMENGPDETKILHANGTDAPRTRRVNGKLILTGSVLAIVIAGAFFGYRYYTSNSGTKQIESIAVMPFVNDSGNPDIEYLSDGMTETLISSLTSVPGLNVKSRSSVFRYKEKDTDPKSIGKDLNVQAILNGRIVERADQVTLSLELVDVATENAIWSQQYTRRKADLVSLQSEIARDVSTKLKSRLSSSDLARVEKSYTANPAAYQLYLKGRYQWNKRTSDSLKQAVDFFNQAVAIDPNYALAYSGLAESYVLFPNYSVAHSLECMPKAKSAALRAIELDDSLAETHTALGTYYSEFAWNQQAAEREFRRAIELNPNYATAHQQFGIECLTPLGRFDEAIAEGKRAVELDPASPIVAADLGSSLFKARRFDEAITQLNKTAALDQNFSVTNWYLGLALHAKGQYADAIAAYRKALAGDDNPWAKALLIRSLAASGQRSDAAKLLGELQADAAHRVVSGASLAIAYASLGEVNRAFEFLDKEITERNSRPVLFSVNPVFDDLRNDPRFAALVQKVEESKLD